MCARPLPLPAIRTIRFSRRVADRCRHPWSPLPDWVLCDAIANGRREAVGRGPEGGMLVRFERDYPRAEGRNLPETRVSVLAEVGRRECHALLVLAPRLRPRKISGFRGFLHRPGPK